jgi:two-component sensor histidine kinase
MQPVVKSSTPFIGVNYAALTEEQKTMGLEIAAIGVAFVDYVADTITLDANSASLFGLPPGAPVSRTDFHARIHPADWPEVRIQIEKLLDPAFNDIINVTHRTIAADGSTRWVRARKRLYRDQSSANNSALNAVATIQDITGEVEGKLANDLLIGELQHRTRNLITVISAIASLVMKSGNADTFLDRFLPRLANLAGNKELVNPTEGMDLRATVHAALTPFVSMSDGKVVIDGPAVPLNERASQTFAMVVHELATNALKYGALSRVGGVVRISWDRSTIDSVVFSWKESGGPPVVKPSRNGFGSKILEKHSANTLSGESQLEYHESGVSYKLSVPELSLSRLS